MTSQSSGGSGSGLPGVTTDNKTPGGEVIAGALTAGDSNAASAESDHHISGFSRFQDAPANNLTGNDVVDIIQSAPLNGASNALALYIERSGSTVSGSYAQNMVVFEDDTNSTHAILAVIKNGVPQFQVDGDGVQVHGKFKVGSAVTHTLGAYSGKSLPIYDESGTLVGYAPCYA